jgi:hypothetical protein
MTDRVRTLTVVLDKDTRTDDVVPLVEAVRQLRGVADVGLDIADSVSFMAESRADAEWRRKLIDMLWPERKLRTTD